MIVPRLIGESCMQACVNSMASCECIGPVKTAMKIRKDMIGVACEALMQMYQTGNDELTEQVFSRSIVRKPLSCIDGLVGTKE
jgi:DnaJ family protein C protein 13